MKLEQLTLENFMGWAHLDVDLSKYNGIVAVLGSIESDMAHSNGTGKSSLIAGINYALYGSTPKDCPNLDGMIHQVSGVSVESGYKVILRFSHADKKYEVLRRKKAGSAQKTVFRNLTDDQPMSVTVEDFLCMPEVVWQNTVFSAQRNLSAFVDKTPSVRKDILTEIFGMNNYLELENKARQLSTQSESALVRVQQDLDRDVVDHSALTATQADVDQHAAAIAEMEARIVNMHADAEQLAIRLSELNQKSAEYDRIVVEIRQLDTRYANLLRRQEELADKWEQRQAAYEHAISSCEAEISQPLDPNAEEVLRIQIDTAEQTRPAIDDLKRQQDVIVQQLATAKAEMDQAEKTVWEYKGQIDDLPKDKCPLCGTNMTEEHLNKHRGELQAHADAAATTYAERKVSINNLSINLQNIRGDLARLSVVINSIPSLSRNLVAEQMKKTRYTNAQNELKRVQDEKAAAAAAHTEAYTDLTAEVAHCKIELDTRRGSMPVVDDIINQKQQAISQKNDLDQQILQLHPVLDSARHQHSLAMFQLTRRTELEKKMVSSQAAVKAAAMQRNIHLELVKAFGPTGIPTLVLENCLTELQQYLDHYMNILSDGKIHVTFQTIKTNVTTAKTSETLAIMVSDINGERDIALYSGGETIRIYLAIRLALAKLLYLKSGQKLGLLIIDEISDLDDAGLLAFVELLKCIEVEFEQILLVSHIPDLKSAFNSCLVLSRDLESNLIVA